MPLLKSKSISIEMAPQAAFTMAQAGDRAGGYTVEQLQALLQPLLESSRGESFQCVRWPLAFTLPAALLVSLGLWYGLGIAVLRLI